MRGLSALALLLTAIAGSAQEPLSEVLARETVNEWFVVGPIAPTVAGGVQGALAAGAPLLDRESYQEGGAIRPSLDTPLTVVGQSYPWKRIAVLDGHADLSDLMAGQQEGVVYAGVYVQAPAASEFLLEVHSPLGARVFFNGFPVEDISTAPIGARGVARHVLQAQRGANLILLQMPMLAMDRLADVFDTPPAVMTRELSQNRDLLDPGNGFVFACRIRPAARFEDLVYVPKLYDIGLFSKSAGQTGQDASAILFNPGDIRTEPLDILVEGMPAARIAALYPGERRSVRLSVPVTGSDAVGALKTVEVTLQRAERAASFAGAVTVRENPASGRVYCLTGNRYDYPAFRDQAARTNAAIDRFRDQVGLHRSESDYGFDLGTVQDWLPCYLSSHSHWAELRGAIRRGQCAVQAGYAALDERLVCGETLARNLAWGHFAAEALAGGPGKTFLAWERPGLAPQTPQLLAQVGVHGVVSSLPVAGIPVLSWWRGPDGSRMLMRRKEPSPGPGNVVELQLQAASQRRELLAMGLHEDILVARSLTAPPERFWANGVEILSQTIPEIVVTGAGADQWFQTYGQRGALDEISIDALTRCLTAGERGSMVAQPWIKAQLGHLQNLLLSTEKLSVYAGLMGAPWPEDVLDYGWRTTFYCASVDRTGASIDQVERVDMAATLQRAIGLVESVRDNTMSYLAGRLDSGTGAPVSGAAARAMTVFNPAAQARSALCRTWLPTSDGDNFRMLDAQGREIACIVEAQRSVGHGDGREVLVSFPARDLPSLGYASCYLDGSAPASPVIQGKGAEIENDRMRLTVDVTRGGAIMHLVDKETGRDFADEGLLNDFWSVELDPDKSANGKELWTTGRRESVAHTGATPDVRVWKGEGIERLVVSVPFMSGELLREMTLVDGVPWVECRLWGQDIAGTNQLFLLSFASSLEGRVPVFGERFGAIAGSPGKTAFDYRTDGLTNPSGTGLQPALNWVALGPGDGIQLDTDHVLPLHPATVVVGDEPSLRKVADEIQTAFAARAIPCTVRPDRIPPLNPLWTDATTLPNLNDELDHGARLRIVVGGPDYNLFCRRILEQVPEAAAGEFIDKMSGGAVLACLDYDVPQGYDPMPTLVFAAHTTEATMDLVRAFALSIRADGVARPRDVVTVDDMGTVQPQDGLALLFEHSALAGVEPDGGLVLCLSTGGDLPVLRYGIMPMRGAWRSAALPQLANSFAQKPMAVTGPLHRGDYAARQGFLSVSQPDFVITGVKAAGYERAAMGTGAIHPRSGFAVRGYDAAGTGGGVAMRMAFPVYKASQTGILEGPGDPIGIVDSELVFEMDSFAVTTLWLQAEAARDRNAPTTLSPAREDTPELTAFWRHNTGPAPVGGIPLSLNITESDTGFTVHVANNLTEGRIAGVADVEGPAQWRIDPQQMDYDLGPGESTQFALFVLAPPETRARAGLRVSTESGGRTSEAVWLDPAARVVLDARQTESGVSATIQNETGIAARGWVELVLAGPVSPGKEGAWRNMAARLRQPVQAMPFASQSLRFLVPPELREDLIAIKLAANSQTRYIFLDSGI